MPAHPLPPEAPHERGAAGEPVRLRVLHVEDNPVTALLLKQLLADEPGILVRTVPSGAEALALARRWPVDALVLDRQLPDISGPELLKQLRQLPQLDGVPAWMCSAEDGPQALTQALTEGFEGYWHKTALAGEAVDTLLALAQRLNA